MVNGLNIRKKKAMLYKKGLGGNVCLKGNYRNNTKLGYWYNGDGQVVCNYTEQLWRLTQNKNKSVWGDDYPQYYVDYVYYQKDVEDALYFGL